MVVLDALTYAGNVDNLAGLESNPRYVFVKGDICDEGAVRELLETHRSIRSCISRPNRMSIARSWDPTISSAPMWSAHIRC